MLLTILIPTYNRAKDLDYNISLLERYVSENNLKDKVSILISNNFSQDNTIEVVSDHIHKGLVRIEFYSQETNIGLEANALFCLGNTTSEYVMFLGDDDYLDERYLLKVIDVLSTNKKIHCIVPSFLTISKEKQLLKGSRDLDVQSRLWSKGFESCLHNSWRGHQLSGIVYKREPLFVEYKKRGLHNLYPFIFFVAYSSLSGDLLHLTEFPVKVTVVPQLEKDWDYGEDGLLNDIFDNYKYLGVSKKQRALLEEKILMRHSWRFMCCKNQCFVNQRIENVFFGKNLSIMGKYCFAILLNKNNWYTGFKLIPLLFIAKMILFIRNLIRIRRCKIIPKMIIKCNKSLKSFFAFFLKYYKCPICHARFDEYMQIGTDADVWKIYGGIGAGTRKAMCPSCYSTDRERLVYFYFKDFYFPKKKKQRIKMLHIAPERQLSEYIMSNKNVDYIAADKKCGGYSYPEYVRDIDIMDMHDIADDTFDVVVCNHVLEHVLDDIVAMKELRRVMKQNGIAVLQVPYALKLEKTFEDKNIVTPEARFEAYGQRDHVRLYGLDYVERLRLVGFKVDVLDISPKYSPKFGLNPNEHLFVCHK